jgi:hypothetical protein
MDDADRGELRHDVPDLLANVISLGHVTLFNARLM